MSGGEEEETTRDGFLDGKVMIRQPSGGHRAGLESVFLAATAPSGLEGKALELGAGAGTASVCLGYREKGVELVCLERDEGLARLAEENVESNGLGGRVVVLSGEVEMKGERWEERGYKAGSFDWVMMNPPFHMAGERTGAKGERASSRTMENWAPWGECAGRMCAAGGRLGVVCPPWELTRLLESTKRWFGGVRLYPLWRRRGEESKRALAVMRKGARGGLRFLGGMALHEADGSVTKEAEGVLREGEAVDVWG